MGGGAVRVSTCAVVTSRRGMQMSAPVKVPNQCPFVLMEKVGWTKGRVVRSGLLRVDCREKEIFLLKSVLIFSPYLTENTYIQVEQCNFSSIALH